MTALERQLGLKVEAAKGKVDFNSLMAFDVVDDDHRRWLLGRHEAKSELFAKRSEQRRPGVGAAAS